MFVFLCIQREANLLRSITTIFLNFEFYTKYSTFIHMVYVLPLLFLLVKNLKTYIKVINEDILIICITAVLIVIISQIVDNINHTKNLTLLTIEESLELSLPFFLFSILQTTKTRLQALNEVWGN